MKRLFRICLGILGLYLLACAAIGITVAEMALHPHRRTLTPADEAKAPLWAQDDGAIFDYR